MEHSLGVLLVHGIGEQPRGDTLLAFGEPLIRVVQDWVDGRSLGSVTVARSRLSVSRLAPEEPAHAVLDLEIGDKPASWLLAESWWAGEFRRPPFMKLAGWLLTVGPWAIISHASRWARDAPPLELPFQLLKVLVAIPASWLMQIVVVMLAVLAWLPIPILRRAVSGFLLRISGTLGDSYVLLENPVQKAAAIKSIHDSVTWLADRCDNIVVVAHSQGAAISRMALDQYKHPRVRLLVTFGSGVSKLSELESRSTGRLARSVRLILALSLVALALLPQMLSKAGDSRALGWSLFLIMPLAFLAAAVSVVWDELKTAGKRAPALSLAPLDWVDYWSTSDPVPNGPLAPPNVIERFQAVRVTNRMSWYSDHSSYWENRDEFVLPLLGELDRLAGAGIFAGEEPVFAPMVPLRRTRVWFLFAIRAATILSAAIALYAFRDKLLAYGRDAIFEPLAVRPLGQTLTDLLSAIGSIFGALIGPLAGWNENDLQNAGYRVLGALYPLVIVTAWYRFCSLPFWETWDQRDFQWLCRPGWIPSKLIDRLVRPAFFVVIGLVPLAVSIAALFESDPRILLTNAINTVISTVVGLIALIMLLGFALTIWSNATELFRSVRTWIRPT